MITFDNAQRASGDVQASVVGHGPFKPADHSEDPPTLSFEAS